MEQECREFLHGYVRIRVSGDGCRRFLNLCAFHGLFLWQIEPSDGGERVSRRGTAAASLKAGEDASRRGKAAFRRGTATASLKAGEDASRRGGKAAFRGEAEAASLKAGENVSRRGKGAASLAGAGMSSFESGITDPEAACISCDLSLMAADFKKLRPLARKSHVRVRILRRRGLPFFLRRNRKRIFWPAGILAALLFMAWLSAHVWNIRIEGNFSQTDDVIFEYLKQQGIRYGMPKSQVDCEALSFQIRNYFTRFSWVSADLSGTLLTIYVKEGIAETSSGNAADTATDENAGSGSSKNRAEKTGGVTDDAAAGTSDASEDAGPEAPTALAAAKAGTVVSIYVRSGLPLVEAGDEVEEGELLVTGALPVYNDDGEVASWQDVVSDADIVLRTQLSYYDEISFETEEKRYTGREKTAYALRAGVWMFSLPDSFDAFEHCEITGVITQARLTGYFYLPLYGYRYTAKEYETVTYIRTREQTEEVLQKNLQNFMKNLEEKGVQIFRNDVTIEWYEDSAAAAGVLTVDESAVNQVAAEHTEEEKIE